jgi:hypothetical protein
MTTYTLAASPNQVKTRRVSYKSSPDRRPLAQVTGSSPVTIVFPILISRAAAVERRRIRHEQCLEAYTLLRLLQFVWVVTRRVREIKKMSPRQAYDYAHSGKTQGRTHPDLRAYYRLQSLLRNHQHALSQQATNIIRDAFDWYDDLCLEMKEYREQGAPSLYELIYAGNKAVHERTAKERRR